MTENTQPIVEKNTPGPVEWYALHVLSGQENRIKKNIDTRIKTEEMGDLIRQVIIPIEKVSEIKRGKKVETERKLYPGYIFIEMILRDHEKKMIDRSWYFIKETNGIIGFADGDHPLPMPRDQVESMLKQIKEKEDKVVPKVSHQVGDRVKVEEGPFQSQEGVIEEIDHEKGKIRVSVSLFGRSTPVELEFWQVEKIQ